MEFAIKHPIITYLIVAEICTTVKTAITGRYRNGVLEEVGGVVTEEANKVLDKKEPIGFRFTK